MQNSVTSNSARNSSVLVFSLALNGYQWLYRNNFESQKRYANKQGYDYALINKPYFTSMGVECCWLKLTLMKQALETGYSTVLYLDADTEIRDCAPPLNTAFKKTKTVYMANGYTGRFNAGVILIKRHYTAMQWLNQIIASRNSSIPEADSVGWGENGHIIHHSKNKAFVQTLENKWNNTFDAEVTDYIRHENFGPLRQNPVLGMTHKCLNIVTRVIRHSKQLLSKWKIAEENIDDLAKLTNQVTQLYSQYFGTVRTEKAPTQLPISTLY